jgi:hypothetical protein
MRRDRRPARWVALAAWTAAWAWVQHAPSGLSWHFFADGSRMLFHGSGLNLYAQHPDLQIGPLAFVVAQLLAPLNGEVARVVAQVLMTAAGPLMVAWIAPLVETTRRTLRLWIAVFALMPAWTVLAVRWSHLDDVLALVLAIAALRAVAANRAAVAGLALAGAVAAKPWALGFIPLLLVLERRRLVAAGTALAGMIVTWAPFLIANPATLASLRPPVAVAPSSSLHALGYRGLVVPAWDRVAQFLLEPAAAFLCVLRARWPGILLVAIAVRLTLDPKDNAYYIGGAALAAVVFDLLATRWTVPWTTLATAVVWWQPFVNDYEHRFTTSTGLARWWFDNPGPVSSIHLGWALAVVALVVLAPRWLLLGSFTPGPSHATPGSRPGQAHQAEAGFS